MPRYRNPIWFVVEADTAEQAQRIMSDLAAEIVDLDGRVTIGEREQVIDDDKEED